MKNDENLLIKYYDTLNDYNRAQIYYENHFKKYHTNIISNDTITLEHSPYSKEKFNNAIDKYDNKLKKCLKKITKRTNTIPLYVYNKNFGVLPAKNIVWIVDPGIFKNLFFKNMYEFDLLIIKPNGEYFLKFGHFSDSNLIKLLNHNDWSNYKSDWYASIKSNSKEGVGVIKKFKKIITHHINHCF